MFRKICKWFVLMMPGIMGWACENELMPKTDVPSSESNYSTQEQALSPNEFALPLGGGYNWGLSQSWGEHCDECEKKYSSAKDELSYCDSSHMGTYTYYGWDFTLPGKEDKGKSVLASADGTVFDTGYSKSWGNWVLIDHGGDLCTRYAHMLDGSITVNKGQQACQGLKIGGIGDTGALGNFHLHFQFESCKTHLPMEKGFGVDGTYIPKCLSNSDAKASPLKFLNTERLSCGWNGASCGNLSGCPLSSGCGNKGKPSFGDLASLDSLVSTAVGYLWQECAVSGKSDGKFHPEDKLTRAEGLKIALQTFGLAGNCKVSEPFDDVKSSDWFYPYVLCGVKHGLIDTIYTGFLPNQELTFSEAAKMAVEAAKKAGKIEIKFPNPGHFSKDKLPITHWAYKYLETVYFYGGITSAMLVKDPYDNVTRGEYAVMAAALSPCFCSSVKCGSGCSCKQEDYYCGQNTVQTSGPVGGGQTAGSGSGGQSSQYDAWSSGSSGADAGSGGGQYDAGYTPSSCKPYCYNKQCGPDGCGGNCGACASGQFCSYGKCEYICSWPSCQAMSCECGMCSWGGPGCEGLKVGCGTCPGGKQCVNNKCICAPNCVGKQCGSDGCGGNCGICGSGSFCDGGQCKTDIQQWVCEPSKGYSLKAASPGGTWEITHPSSSGPSYIQLPMNGELAVNSPSLKVNCDELPTSILIKGGSQWVKILVGDKTLPPLEVWLSYSGPLMPGPTSPPTLKTYELDLPAYSNLFIRVPASFGVSACTSNCYGKQCGADGCGGSCGNCAGGQTCTNGQCMQPPPPQPPAYSCDPAKGYKLMVYSPGGSWQALASPNNASYSGAIPSDSSLSLKFYCSELPGATLIKGGPQGVYVWLDDKTLPNFALWSSYYGSMQINPSYNPDVVTSYFYTPTPNTTLLVRVPGK